MRTNGDARDMTAAELAAKIAERFTCKEGFYSAFCETGEQYVMFAQRGGVADEAKCCEAMLVEFERYVEQWEKAHVGQARPTLYWRYAPPHVHWRPDDAPEHYSPARLGCRLVLSNLPVIYEAVTEYRLISERTPVHGLQRQPYQPADQEQRDRTDSSAS